MVKLLSHSRGEGSEDEDSELTSGSKDDDVREGSILWGHGGLGPPWRQLQHTLGARFDPSKQEGNGRDIYLAILEEHFRASAIRTYGRHFSVDLAMPVARRRRSCQSSCASCSPAFPKSSQPEKRSSSSPTPSAGTTNLCSTSSAIGASQIEPSSAGLRRACWFGGHREAKDDWARHGTRSSFLAVTKRKLASHMPQSICGPMRSYGREPVRSWSRSSRVQPKNWSRR